MPTLIRRLTTDGLQEMPYTAETLAAAADQEPNDGVYTAASTRNRYDVLKLNAHLDRLYDSAQRQRIPFTLPREQIRAGLRALIDAAGYDAVKFRITVPRDHPNQPILTVEPFAGYPTHLYTNGVKVVTVANSARHNPAAKDTAWMHNRKTIEEALPPDAYTAILLDADGNLLEGTSSNFYAIHNNTLHTAEEGVLPGMAQQIVLTVAPGILPISRQPVTHRQVPQLQEAFISSSSRDVMPVVQIDDTRLGDGTPGPVHPCHPQSLSCLDKRQCRNPLITETSPLNDIYHPIQ